GIPTILISLAMFALGFVFHRLWWVAFTLFVAGWLLQFIGHAFEGKTPEVFQDWRFLFVCVRWWWGKMNGKAWMRLCPSWGSYRLQDSFDKVRNAPICFPNFPVLPALGLSSFG